MVIPTVLVAQASVRTVERLSPGFVRVTLESPSFADLGIEGFDTRLKLIFPGRTGDLPSPSPPRTGTPPG
jgi:NADPH-dependent ferric siderophore reductase